MPNFPRRSTLMRLFIPTLLALLVGSGCATFVTVDGYQMYENQWNVAKADVTRRAAFDLTCDAAAVQLSVLKASCHGLSTSVCKPEQVGVHACGKQAVYVDVGAKGWIMN